ncbi:MAG: DUF3368 domain-containing protein [Anaerolineales bacterium]|nr:DUF3368 domain-containing protein [Anaerolineales bacterium]
MPKIGTLGILLKAKEIGLVSVLKPEIEELQRSGFSISPLLVEEILDAAGE